MSCATDDCLILEFLNSLNVDWPRSYRGQEDLISFQIFNMDHKMSLTEFNELLRLPIYLNSFRDVPSR